MDPEPDKADRTSTTQVEVISNSSHKAEIQQIGDEDPFGLSGPSIALLGLVIAFATIGVPLAVVLTERPLGRESVVPTALEPDGSKPSLPISLTRVGKPSS